MTAGVEQSATGSRLPVGPWATGVGSMPGTDLAGTLDVVVAELGAAGVPFVPELPDRGVGADMIGRTAGFLVDLPVDLQPAGWRLVDRPGRDLRRARAHWRDDLDALAERGGELAGARALKVSVVGPWTLAAALARPRGEVAVSDPGARRDLVDSLAEGVRGVLAELARAASGTPLVLQLDEPSATAVLAGRLPTASGYGSLRAVEPAEVRAGLRTVIEAARATASAVIMHSCATDAPWRLFREAGADGLALPAPRAGSASTPVEAGVPSRAASTMAAADAAAGVEGAGAAVEVASAGRDAVSVLGAPVARQLWETLARLVEEDTALVLGVLDPMGLVPRPDAAAGVVLQPWRDLGLSAARLAQVAVAPDCGAAGAVPTAAAGQLRVLTRAAEEIAERAVS